MRTQVTVQATYGHAVPRLARPIGEAAAWLLSGLAALVRTCLRAHAARRPAKAGVR